MANYNWHDYQDRPWPRRFPEGTRGLEVWRQYADFKTPAIELAQARRGAKPLLRPCVFVSHRRTDVSHAGSIADLACREGFDVWLDVLDPELAALTRFVGATPGQAAAVAVAAIIEMALLNSTHVVAVMTPNSKGSQWVPYEYGRVKDPLPVTLQAACWRHPDLALAALPEYLYLGTVTNSMDELQHWLSTEFRAYRAGGAGSPGVTW